MWEGNTRTTQLLCMVMWSGDDAEVMNVVQKKHTIQAGYCNNSFLQNKVVQVKCQRKNKTKFTTCLRHSERHVKK